MSDTITSPGMPANVRTTAGCSEIGSLTSLEACNSGASSDVREPISLHQAVHKHVQPELVRMHDAADKHQLRQLRVPGSISGLGISFFFLFFPFFCKVLYSSAPASVLQYASRV